MMGEKIRVDESAKQTEITLTDALRIRFKYLLDPIGGFLNRLGIAPNTLTISGLAGNAIGAYFLARGSFMIGGLILLSMGAIDALDGTMARLRGEPSDFGAFVDSVTDRYSELVIYAGLLFYAINEFHLTLAMLVFGATAGSILVSYVRARAQSLGYEAKGGMLTRFERFIVLIPSLVFGYPWIGVGLIAVLANITALQRIISVRQQAHKG
ncbi:MAG: CDP-alcohol phosphatidyltransferase family protein [Anaerolineales bacterium]|nr:CDP-alcohol phosphatidyltransferase family protein [Anaerolineales bacterium]